MPGAAFEKAFEGEVKAFEGAVFLKGGNGVMGAGGVETARATKKWA